ncbi:MAG: hypothetical protein HY462_00075 [Parcubacteria group bacterium]|nr:hypothetical protein [Parcubacteria group bacterium]
MTTEVIGIKEFRQNITSLWKKARKKDTRYIVMHHSTPIFEVMPLSGNRLVLEKLARDVQKAREEARQGKLYTTEEVLKHLGL